MAGFQDIFEQRRKMFDKKLDCGWNLSNDHPGRISTLGSLDLGDVNNEGQQGTMLWEGEQRQRKDINLAPIGQRTGGHVRTDMPVNAGWNSSPFAMQSSGSQFSSDAPKMDGILIDFGQVIEPAPSDMANMAPASHLTSRETAFNPRAFGASIGWRVARGQSQRDVVPIGPSSYMGGTEINHSTNAPPPNPRSRFSSAISSNSANPRPNIINTSRLSVTIDADPGRRRTSSATKAEQRTSDLEDLDLVRRTANTYVSPSSARGIWDSLPTGIPNNTNSLSNDNENIPLSSIPSESATVVGESSPITSASEEQKKAISTISAPPDRRLSTSIHASAAATPSQSRRRGEGRQKGHWGKIAVRGEETNERDGNPSGATAAVASGSTASQPGTGRSKGSSVNEASTAWRVKSEVDGGEHARDQSVKHDGVTDQDQTKAEDRLPSFFSTQALFQDSPPANDQAAFDSPPTVKSGSLPSGMDETAAASSMIDDMDQAVPWRGEQTDVPGTESNGSQSGDVQPPSEVVLEKFKVFLDSIQPQVAELAQQLENADSYSLCVQLAEALITYTMKDPEDREKEWGLDEHKS
ncbi:hypothetical protein QFC22_001876 [Naganishia vaughanmartiniae]|uniref:Uncharacterized protein n=1 Tax=Naganishia vaughanmartiniae TaxID=1424756 RepID=A0ACC2XFN3_9TREE|nr:hypothetical protein QFC22_001876 [Naganishia vaughanmartiniae]